MKIINLKFKNLNSLYGEWSIDFSDPEYVSNGIFALTGPTGAGKSTILDAISLALYGCTPRLGKITDKNNEVISRRTGECYAEVEFESQEGRFRSRWEQHRARKKNDADLVGATHEISDAKTGDLLETKISKVPGVVEEKIGMDFDRFTRSVLLAQGKFDEFLKAKPTEKSETLEQITGTEVYSKISTRVHLRCKEEKDKLENLKADSSKYTVLSIEDEKSIRQKLLNKQKQESDLDNKKSEVNENINWVFEVEGLKNEVSSLSKKVETSSERLKSFEPERNKLSRAKKAADLDVAYTELKGVREAQEKDQKLLEREEIGLPDLDGRFKEIEKYFSKAEAETDKSKEQLKDKAPLIKKVRSLDQSLRDKDKIIKNKDKICNEVIEEIEKNKKSIIDEEIKADLVQKEVEDINKYLDEHKSDRWLISGFTGIEEQLNNLSLMHKDIIKVEKDKQAAIESNEYNSKELANYVEQNDVKAKQLQDISASLKKEQGKLNLLLQGHSLREYSTEKENLIEKKMFVNKIATLEEERRILMDGKECPLCGSKEHPYAEGNIPDDNEYQKRIDEIDALVAKVENIEDKIKKVIKTEKEIQSELNESEKEKEKASSKEQYSGKQLKDVSEQLEKLKGNYEDKIDIISKELLDHDYELNGELSIAIDELRSKKFKIEEHDNSKRLIDERLSSISGKIKEVDAKLIVQKKRLADEQAGLELEKKEFATMDFERQELFGSKDPEEEETNFKLAITKSEEVEKETRGRRDKIKISFKSSKDKIANFQQNIKDRASILKDIEAGFKNDLQNIGFVNEDQFLAARLDLSQRAELESKAKELDSSQIELAATLSDRTERFNKEKVKDKTEKQLSELEFELESISTELKQLQEDIVNSKEKLRDNAKAKQEMQTLVEDLEIQQEEFERWDYMRTLIGSADGMKYRNFVQGITFKQMLLHANNQLKKMMDDRYQLISDDASSLELNIKDNYQAGEIRSVKNLSGGESFIVSLALSLGLSQMSSKNVRVDSLFLDEGFGTLDEESLETALDTLAGLQQGGKLIGIISHVAALKDRISTQINVSKLSGGKSSLDGPGCRRL